MATKKKTEKKEQPLIINGTWLDVIKASVKGNPPSKKKATPKK